MEANERADSAEKKAELRGHDVGSFAARCRSLPFSSCGPHTAKRLTTIVRAISC